MLEQYHEAGSTSWPVLTVVIWRTEGPSELLMVTQLVTGRAGFPMEQSGSWVSGFTFSLKLRFDLSWLLGFTVLRLLYPPLLFDIL